MQNLFKAEFLIKGGPAITQNGFKNGQMYWTVDSTGQRNC